MRRDFQIKLNKLGWNAPGSDAWRSIVRSKPKIAILAPPLDSVPSPDGNAIYTLVDDLATKMTVPVLILSRALKEGYEAEGNPERMILYYRKVFAATLLERILPYRLRKKIFGMAGLRYFNYAKSAVKVCEMLGVNTILVQDVPWFAVLIKKNMPDARIFLHQHIDAPLGMTRNNWFAVQRACNGVIYVSHSVKNQVSSKYGEHLVPAWVIYNGVDLGHYSQNYDSIKIHEIKNNYRINQDERVLLFVGRIIPGKGPLEAAKAFLVADLKNTKFLIAGNLNQDYFGDDGYASSLIALADESQGKVVLAGVVGQDIIPALYQLCHVVIIPSIQPEGLPKVMTEAIAMNKPCIVSDRGGMKELLCDGANGWLLKDPTDINAMSKTIAAALSDEKKPACDRSFVDLNRMVAQMVELLGHG